MRKRFKYVILVAMVTIGSCMVTSCSDSDEPDGIIDAPREWIDLNSSQEEYLHNSVLFSVDLWHALNAMQEYEKENIIFSPLSTQISLSLLANGASGEKLKALTDILLPDCENPSIEKLNDLNSLMIEKLSQVDKNAKFKMANSVWFVNGPDLSNEYISSVSRYYDSWLFRFDRGTETSRNAINKWVEDVTEGTMKEFLDGAPTQDVVFLSAMLFKHGWKKKFEKSDTKLEDFYCESGEVVKVPMMYKEDEAATIYTHEKSLRAVVPFGNGAFTLHLIKPDEGCNVNEALEAITKATDIYSRKLKLKLPRFSIGSDIDFINVLYSMGLEDILRDSDYSAMTSTPLEIMSFRQKSQMEVDEEGAVYKVVTSPSSPGEITAYEPPAAIVEFYLDHPFAFEIHEESTGAIIAMGKICNL